MTARHQARLVATLAIALSGITTVATAQTRAGNPQAPKLLVGTLKSTDQKLGPDAAEAIRDRIGGDVSLRNLTVIPKADILNVLGSSGYPTNEALSPADMNALARQTRADEYIEGSATKTATGFQVELELVLARDQYLRQPLGTFDHVKLEGMASLVSKAFQEAQKAFEPEKRCRLLAREGKTAEAQKEAAQGLVQFPKSVWLRACKLSIAIDTKRPGPEIIATAEDLLTVDPQNRAALSELVKQYDLANNKDKKIEVLLKLYRADPSNPKLLSDVVNELALSGKFEMARPIIVKAVAENPGDAALIHTYWLILGALDDRREMNKIGAQMVQIDTSLADSAYYDRTFRAYAADSSYQEAAAAAAKAAAKFPKAVNWLVVLQQLQKLNGQTQQQVATIRRVMALDPKALPAARGIMAQAYIDMNQPDSALDVLREGVKAGDDKLVMSSLVLRIANARQTALGKDSTHREDVEEWKKLYALMSFADSISATVTETKASAKFLLGVSAFQIGYLTLKNNNSAAHSCDAAHEAQKYLLEAVKYIPAGGSFAAQQAAQYMGILNDMLPNADRSAQIFCRTRPDSTKTKKP